VSFVIGCLLLLFPLVAFYPYRWFVFDYAADSIVTPQIGQQHQGIHLAVWFLFTFFPFSALSFFLAFLFLIWNWRRSRAAKWLSLGAAALFVGAIVLPVLFFVA
jgi:hypothetical protein